MSSPPSKKLKPSCFSDSYLSNKQNELKLNNSNGVGNNGEMAELDEGLYSRQLYVIGTEGMRRMAASDILISGLGGLGLEVAKNIVLAGVRSVTLHDPSPLTWSDLSSHFFATPEDIGQAKVDVCRSKLTELNDHVAIYVINKPKLALEDLKKFTTLVLCQSDHDECVEISTICHGLGVKFVAANTYGVFGRVFCDFGEDFSVVDTNGEEPPSVMIQQVEKSQQGLVTCLEECRHEFEDGDHVTFSEVKGMEELNGCEPRRVSVVGPDAFSIGDTSDFSSYVSGGICKLVKMLKHMSFKPYGEAFMEPEILISDFVKFDRGPQLHLCFKALSDYTKRNGTTPASWNETDAQSFIQCVQNVNEGMKNTTAAVSEIDEQISSMFSFTCSGQCCPMQAVIGGFTAQEALKSCTGKFTPLNQWLYFDAVECLPSPIISDGVSGKKDFVIGKGDTTPRGSRYDGQVAIFGNNFQEKIANLNYLMAGAGAIGCELLKNFALMGVGASANGKITVTDMDSIERSNLNRQFLFRPGDISKMKSVVAASVVKKMNPEINIEAHENRLGPESESVYDDCFFNKLDGVVNALDNIETRTYMDRRCVYYHKSLLESGTLGTKGNVQVVIPHLTESYSSSHDPPEKSFPACTLKNFPYLIEHTIQWARDSFEGIFVQQSQSMASFIGDPARFIDRTLSGPGNQPLETLETLKANLIVKRPNNFVDCITWARLLWQDLYANTISQLLFNFPSEHTTSTGVNFWSGTKRCPHPLVFDPNKETHMGFVVAAANLRAHIFGISECRNTTKIATMVQAVSVPAFKPRAGIRIDVTEAEAQARSAAPLSDASKLEELKSVLTKYKPSKDQPVFVIEFEKDDDSNFHMDFITAASNLRAECYQIQPEGRLKTKLIAGKIIPAIATTTSIIAGLVCLELFKLVQGHTDIGMYKNAFINLAQPLFTFYEPVPPAKSKYYDTEFTLWDRFDLYAPMTLQQFIDYLKEKHRLTVTMLSQDVSMLFAFFMPEARRKERLAMPLTQLVQTVSKRPIPSHAKALVFDLCCSDTDGEDVDVPYVCYHLSGPEK